MNSIRYIPQVPSEDLIRTENYSPLCRFAFIGSLVVNYFRCGYFTRSSNSLRTQVADFSLLLQCKAFANLWNIRSLDFCFRQFYSSCLLLESRIFHVQQLLSDEFASVFGRCNKVCNEKMQSALSFFRIRSVELNCFFIYLIIFPMKLFSIVICCFGGNSLTFAQLMHALNWIWMHWKWQLFQSFSMKTPISFENWKK